MTKQKSVDLPSITALLTILLLGAASRFAYYVDQVLDKNLTLAESSQRLTFFPFSIDQFIRSAREIRGAYGADRLVLTGAGPIFDILGMNRLTNALLPVGSALLIAVLIFAIGSHLKRNTNGLLATFLWLGLPVGIFISPLLLPAMPMILVNTLAIYLYFRGKTQRNWIFYALSGLLILSGLWMQWTYTISTVLFVIWDLAQDQVPSAWKGRLVLLAFAMASSLLLLNQAGQAALENYYLTRMIDENLFVVPLLVLGGMFIALAKKDQPSAQLLSWLGIKVAVLIFAGQWVASDPIVKSIGLSGYWLDLMVPGSLVIAWALGSKIDTNGFGYRVIAICLAAVLMLALWAEAPAFLTFSRILFGFTLILFAMILAFWNSDQRLTQGVIFLFLFTFIVGSFSVAYTYWQSYRGPVDNARSILAALAQRHEATLFIADETLMHRFDYIAAVSNSSAEDLALTTGALNPQRNMEIPPGAFVVMSAAFRDFSFGAPPENWILVHQTPGETTQKLLLYQVRPAGLR